MKKKGLPVSDKFLKTKVEITPEQLGNAITNAAKKEVMYAPKEIRDKLAQMFLAYGATVMVELLYVELGMDPTDEEFKDKKEDAENEAD